MINDPLKIGNVIINKRVVLPPMETAKTNPNQTFSDEQIDYYVKRAKNPYIGLIITEHCFVKENGMNHLKQVSISKDSDIDSHKKLVDSVKKANPDIKIFAQISHAGGKAHVNETGFQSVSASQKQFKYSITKELNKNEIIEIENDFACAALRAKKAGYDGVEIHAAHEYLLNQFLSPIHNLRSDEYGKDSIENRTRIIVETLEAIKNTCGDNFVVGVRLGACDYMDKGTSEEEGILASTIIEKAKADFLDISGGVCGPYPSKISSNPCYFSYLSKKIKEEIKIPVIVTGGVKNIEQVEDLLTNKCADLVGVGRPLFANPLWPNK